MCSGCRTIYTSRRDPHTSSATSLAGLRPCRHIRYEMRARQGTAITKSSIYECCHGHSASKEVRPLDCSANARMGETSALTYLDKNTIRARGPLHSKSFGAKHISRESPCYGNSNCGPTDPDSLQSTFFLWPTQIDHATRLFVSSLHNSICNIGQYNNRCLWRWHQIIRITPFTRFWSSTCIIIMLGSLPGDISLEWLRLQSICDHALFAAYLLRYLS